MRGNGERRHASLCANSGVGFPPKQSGSGERQMKRSALVLLLPLAAWPQGAVAQPAAQAPLNAKETQGRALFTQHCVVCHMRTQLTSPGHYGPPLSKATLGGQ